MRSFYVAILGLLLVAMVPVSDTIGQVQKPTKVVKAAFYDVSKPLRDIVPVQPGLKDRSWKKNINKSNTESFVDYYTDYNGPDPVVQTTGSGMRSSDPSVHQNFDGVNNISGVAPPDTDGDVGPDHYMQMVNLAFAIYDKEGGLLYGPANSSTIWDGFIGPWTGTNDGDPIVMYDEYSDRWIASQFALPNGGGNPPWYELVAVSVTGDPTGEWYRYAFEFDNFPDYPKLGVWRDGYYLMVRQFSPWGGPGIAVLDRDAMIEGDPDAEMIFFDMSNNLDGVLPADADGTLLPPEGAPGIIMGLGGTSTTLRMWEVNTDWETPDNSTLSFKQAFPVEPYNTNGITVRQPGTSQQLDVLPGFMKYRLQYRNFGDYEVLLACHDVNAGSGRAGVRWYEFRQDEENSWYVYQQGTYAPDDGDSRWMSSIAMNDNGDIAIGYSVSSTSTYPSIRIAGQTSGAPAGLGVLDINETEIYTGEDSQTGINRWGDYSSMTVDPTDGNTFWYTTEYSTGGWNWRTRIASFGFSAVPVSDFTSSEVIVPVGEDVNYTDLTTGIPTEWEWTFAGGDPETSSDQDPEEIFYNSEGSFDVELVSSNLLGTDTIVKEGFITASTTILPDVAFEADNDFVCLGEEVSFEDMSSHVPIQWLWEFEPATVTFVNGTDASSQNPIVVFDEGAMYNVTLTAWNLNGEASLTKEEYVTAGGFMPYFRETFEDNDLRSNYWTVENPDDEVTWELFATGGTSPGGISAGIDFSNYFKVGERDRLVSPPFNLNGMSSAVLEFRHAYSKRLEEYTDSLIVYVAPNCSDEWVKIFEAGEDGTGNFATQEPMEEFWPMSEDDWCGVGYGSGCVALDLTPWAGESGVRIAFESVSSFGNPLFIDNVQISQFVGTEENVITNEEVNIYPNPTTGTFNVVVPEGAGFTDMNIVNYLGQSVYSEQLSENDRTIQIEPGTNYFVRLTGNGNTTTKKIILN
jgi:PKD repeat protein